ncbi:MAG TPA: glycine zipper domain-containing protein [Gemmataceae bacterium]|nr:glycine zipper domain-containing protein [Gemmataceae bacterium]
MRGRLLAGLAFVAAMPLMTGCAGTSKTAEGAGIGGAIGAGTGALIGKATNGKAGQGALVGGLIGAGVGGLIGNEHDRREKEELKDQVRQAQAEAAASTTGSPIGMSDVIQLTKEGRSDNLIINQIRTTHSTFQLSTEDLRTLSSNGVSEQVIMEMQNRRPDRVPPPGYPPPGRVIYAPAAPVYVVPAPPPPPPPGFGVGVQFRN